METIRILFYTDLCAISQGTNHRGLTKAKKFIELKLAPIANVEISILNRHIDYKNGEKYKYQATKLTDVLLHQYDELWVFGALQATRENPELTQAEIQALTEWMKVGGVMITGDHSDPMSEDPGAPIVNLGSAIGRNIPRAGELRVWDGPPTARYEHLPLEKRENFNTQEGAGDFEKLDDPSLQLDNVPQKLFLIAPESPHRLFWWYFDEKTQKMIYISRFPDHNHEGKLAFPIPEGKDWPTGSPAPTLVAQGRDKRFTDRFIDLVSVFEGTEDAGRIVADSSFHHYINLNLLDIEKADANGVPQRFSDLDQIAQYYANVALWLAPRKLRQRMAWDLFLWAAQHPCVREERSNSNETLGRTALRAIKHEIGISNLYRLIEENTYEANTNAIGDIVGLIFIRRPIDSLNINTEAALGRVIREHYRAFDERGVIDPTCLGFNPNPELVLRALSTAFESSPEILDRFQSSFKAAAVALTV